MKLCIVLLLFICVHSNTTQYNCTDDYCLQCPTNPSFCDVCQDDYYVTQKNSSFSYCRSCSSDRCDTCENNTGCTSCEDGRYLFRKSDYTICKKCDRDCNCDNNGTFCYECKYSGLYLKEERNGNYRCRSCSSNCHTCIDNTNCTLCNDGYYVNQNDLCSSCPQVCEDCEIGLQCGDHCFQAVAYDNASNCTQVCGDYYVLDYECDLGIGTELDGCTDECELEEDFDCYTNSQKESICSYYGQILMKAGKLEESIASQDQVHLQIRIIPNLYMLKDLNPNKYLSFNTTNIIDPHFQFDQETGIYRVTFTITNSFSGNPFLMILTPTTDLDDRFWATNITTWQYEFQYSPSAKIRFTKIMFTLALILVGLSLMICVVGIFSPNRLSGLQITYVTQYLFIVLIWIQKFNLPVYMLRMYRYSAGYAQQLVERTNTGTPPEAYRFQIDTHLFYNNFNFMAVTYIVPLIGLIISQIMYKRKKNKLKELVMNIKNEEKYKIREKYRQKISKISTKVQFFTEFFFYSVMFNLTYLTACLVIFYTYGTMTDIASQVMAALFSTITIIHFILLFRNPANFVRFYYSFTSDPLSFYHYFFHILNIILSVIFICFIPEQPWVPLLPQIFLLIYTLKKKPYNYTSENYRSAFNLFIMCLITSMRMYYFYVNQEELQKWNSYIYPAIIQAFILAGLAWAYFSVVKDIFYKYLLKKNNKNISYDLYQDEETVKKLQQQILENEKFKNSTVLKAFLPQNYESTYSQREKSQYRVHREQIGVKKQKPPLMQEGEFDQKIEEKLKEMKLPHSKQAIQILKNEIQFLKYQKILERRAQFSQKVDPQILEEYAKIQMMDNPYKI